MGINMLNNQEKSQIKALLQSSHWAMVERLAELVIKDIEDTPLIRDSQWETTKATFEKEYQVKGIRHFLSEFYNSAQ